MNKTNLLPEEEMRELGFSDFREGFWYIVRYAGTSDITYNLTINKVTGEYEELVMDEMFGQPYHYMTWHLAEVVKHTVDSLVEWLNRSGLAIEHDHSLYLLKGEG